jgi:hypothetical protein
MSRDEGAMSPPRREPTHQRRLVVLLTAFCVDLLRLFTHPDERASAREQVDVFKFYTGQIATTRQSCRGSIRCGSNYLDNLATVPKVRMIALLRDPVDRAYSFYQMKVRHGFETLPFEEAVEREADHTFDSDRSGSAAGPGAGAVERSEDRR